MSKQALAELKTLASQSEELFQKYLEIRAQRKAAKAKLAADMGCECDDDVCVTNHTNWTIKQNETQSCCHDDQDRGTVTVQCFTGKVQVRISVAVWDAYVVVKDTTVKPGGVFNYKIPEMDSWYDQTNRVEIIGKAVKSTYTLFFQSWDD